MSLDLRMVREVHRCVSKLASVRRADREGEWDLVSAQPGKLRSHAQSFRVGAHVEPAWDHATLRRRVAELINTTRAVEDGVRAVACFIRSFVRAQPFLGHNERVALITASVFLCSVGLPALSIRYVDDPEFGPALIAADDTSMKRVVERWLWTEALALAEWLPVSTSSRSTLADEHRALADCRVPIDLAPLASELTELIEPLLANVGNARHLVHVEFADRLRAATDASYRGHPICAQHPIVETRWSMTGDREAILVIALAGRGIAGAASAHLSIEQPGVVASNVPAVLLPMDEAASNRAERLALWVPLATAAASG
ncbi:MAG: hypothetical protein AB7O24_28120 [Kofleriaceae bacterium]